MFFVWWLSVIGLWEPQGSRWFDSVGLSADFLSHLVLNFFFLWVGWRFYSQLWFLPGYQWQPLQVADPQCSETHISSSSLILRCLPCPRSLSCSVHASHLLTPHLQISIHFQGHLAISLGLLLPVPKPHIPLPITLSPISLSPPNSYEYLIPPSKWDTFLGFLSCLSSLSLGSVAWYQHFMDNIYL